jgi:hypothetical protein
MATESTEPTPDMSPEELLAERHADLLAMIEARTACEAFIWHSGGGNFAIRVVLPGWTYCLLTEEEGCDLPETSDGPWLLGRYPDADPNESIGEVETISSEDALLDRLSEIAQRARDAWHAGPANFPDARMRAVGPEDDIATHRAQQVATFTQARIQFAEAAHALLCAWTDTYAVRDAIALSLESEGMGEQGYPFTESFDELVHKIAEWAREAH